jgi:hypothetical protein
LDLNPTETRVLRLAQGSGQLQTFRTGVSLHSHTHFSRESLEFLPSQSKRIPILGPWIGTKLRRYEESTGKMANFERSWWTPPVSPATVVATESAQIEGLGMAALVSITDHDTIEAGLSLQPQSAATPVSVEWTIPYCGDYLHLGVHHLAPARAVSTMELLARYTADPAPHEDSSALADILASLASSPETLLVLNHPCWDVARIGTAQHNTIVRGFLAQYRPWIHALEVNGLRSCNENRAALLLAQEYDLTTVAGGDRHGCRPNTVLNLTRADSWAGFVEEVRRDGRSTILILPAYDQPIALRQLEIVADALRRYPQYPHGRRNFTDRTFVDLPGYSVHPLSFYWDRGVPPWLRPILGSIVVLGSSRMHPLLRRTIFRREDSDLMIQAE